MTMKRINYKSDFDFFLRLISANGEEIGWPPFDWTAKFRTAAAWQIFEASCIGGVCTNCYNDNGRIHIVADNHKLPPGRLRVDLSVMIPEGVFPDGSRLVVTPAPLDIELVLGTSGLPTSAEAALLLPALKGDKGDSFTYADFTEEEKKELVEPIRQEMANELKNKADREELSPVLVRDPEEGMEMPEPDFPALMLRKNEQALTAEERRQVMVNLGRPDTAAFDLQWAGAGGTVFVPGELYGLNGINDITLAEAMKIWRLSHRDIKVSWQRVYGYNNAMHEEMKPRMFARTYFTLLAPGYEGANFAETFLGNEIVEAVDIAGGYSSGGIHIGLASTFKGCKRLRRVSFGGGKGWGSIRCNTNAFAGCVNLERIDEFGFWAGDQTLDLSMAPKFEVDCIERAVAAAGTQHQNAIILHPDVFAKCSPELLAAAAAKNITITTP